MPGPSFANLHNYLCRPILSNAHNLKKLPGDRLHFLQVANANLVEWLLVNILAYFAAA